MDTFLCSLVQWRSGEGGTLQTNNTGMCWQCLSHTGPAPAHNARALPAHTAQALGCSTGNRPWPALGCMKFPSLSHSGSGTRSPQRRRLGWACVLCPSQVQAAQATRCLVSTLSSGGWCILSPPASQAFSLLSVQRECHLRCAVCLLWGTDLWL